ncbi:AraC family transcriptional regulator [Paucibacter sp. KBW04]|uniref:AraC family transcriptional regulator n=1 Tax=Paucibacter sp. KBW04 TaxID=2153361 RepID=UPI000F585D35|nr:AraC family transcriptional regulator [Paucibacter sp. KBW04]RQO56271.1 AraC family transcriptional regulator [Paucibacter sp. KBW04]
MRSLDGNASNGLHGVLSVRLLVELGREHGLSARSCLVGSGVQENRLGDLAAMVTAEQELCVIRNLLGHLGSIPALGAVAGTRYHSISFGPLGVALTSSASAKEALKLAMRYFKLTFALTRFRVAEAQSKTLVMIDDSSLPLELRSFIVERDAAALVTVQKDLLAFESALTALDFNFPEPKVVAPYKAIFGVRPRFAAKENLATLSTEVLSQPLPQANELILQMAEQQCQLMLEQQESRTGLATQVRVLLTHSIREWSDMQAVAQHFCMTTRTLRRKLLSEGQTFLGLREEVRRALAEQYLLGSGLSIEEMSDKLGFGSPTSFIIAFKRWHGATPFAYRSKQAPGAKQLV